MTSPHGVPTKIFFILGCFSAAIAVAAGAFGAHELKNILSPQFLAVYETAVRYQMYHALGLLAAALTAPYGTLRLVKLAGWSFLSGTILFSGSLYVLTLSGITWFGAITPLGGVAFILGWLSLGTSVWKRHVE